MKRKEENMKQNKRKRSGKFYRKNENEVMKLLGFKPTKNSGAGWIEKEDGENEHCLCQLKSTDANSIKINKLDIDKLLYHASVSKKLPVFAVQFLENNEIFLLVKPEDLSDIAKYIETQEPPKLIESIINIGHEVGHQESVKRIKSGGSAREEFTKENEKKFKKGIRSAT